MSLLLHLLGIWIIKNNGQKIIPNIVLSNEMKLTIIHSSINEIHKIGFFLLEILKLNTEQCTHRFILF